jgi:hypothetical protein
MQDNENCREDETRIKRKSRKGTREQTNTLKRNEKNKLKKKQIFTYKKGNYD